MKEALSALIVEDSEDDALLVLLSLQAGGFAVVWERVQTAEELTAALERRVWDVVISDYRLPRFSAPKALAIIKQTHQDVPFIVVSGTIGDTAAVELMKAGAHDYLMKDNLVRLPEAVRREIREAQVRLDNRETMTALDFAQERLQLALEGSGIGLWDWSVQTGDVTLNERWAEMLGYRLEEISPLTIQAWADHVHPDDLPLAQQLIASHLRRDSLQYRCELRLRHQDGSWIWVLDMGKVVEWDEDNQPLRMIGTQMDITDRKQAELRLALQSSILERIAKSDPLPDILDALVCGIEKQLGDGLCSVLLCDGEGRLLYGAAPNLPPSYNQAVNHLIIAEGMGSCGTAAARREVVIVSNIATDPLWQNFKELALSHGLCSCWSAPAIAGNGEVLATFAVYYHDCRHPRAQELESINLATDILKIAIEQARAAQALEQLNQELEDRVSQRTRALQESEAKLQAILDFAPAAIYVKDLDGRHTLVNRAFLTMFDCTVGDIIGYTNQDFFEPEVAQRLDINDQMVLSAGHFQQYEEDFRVGDTVYTLLSNKFLLFNQEQLPYAICGISTDVSERKATQKALRQKEDRLQRIAANAPGAIYQYVLRGDGSHEFIYMSDRAQDIFELDMNTIQQDANTVFSMTHPDDMPSLQQSIAKSATTLNSWVWEGRFITPSGHLKWLQGIAQPERQPNGDILWDGLILDVSDRKRAEELLQESEEKYRNLVENANDIIYILSLDGVFTYVSPNWTEILGHDIEDVVHQSFVPFVHPDDVPQCMAFLHRMIETGMKQNGVEYRVRHNNGEWRWHTSNAAPQRDQQGAIVSCLGIAHDITDRKQAEELLQRSNAELARATRMKDEFLANMSHELRTPLNAILGMSEGLQEQVFGPINTKQQKAIATVERSGRHLLELINDILDLSKIEAGHLKLELNDVSVKTLCSTSCTFVKQLAFNKQINLIADIPQELEHLKIRVDDRRIRQVLINLLSNAVKFTPDGGQVQLTVSLETSPSRSHSPLDVEHSIWFSVIDNGIGIAQEHLSRLCESFVQIDSSLSRQYAGTGLGLAIVKQLVEMHGGQISIVSEVGRGSCFTVKLPCCIANSSLGSYSGGTTNHGDSAAPSKTSGQDVAEQPLILLAEDNEANILTLSSYLTAKHYRLLVARNGQEAIALIQAVQPDLIVMDVQMPVMDGLEAIQLIRQDHRFTHTPIIALTALAMAGDRDRCLEAGANDYLTKPVRLNHLTATIEQLLQASRVSGEVRSRS
ncbi:MAG: PAS domain S-box protein [Leptolyngbya sp. DLM2.Bin15]|nr:MAG: PAS domain S-box protein [Leptolyngbya sp. DLM2.Bin15]